MADEIFTVTELDQSVATGDRNINIECQAPGDADSYESKVVAFSDLSSADQTLYNDCKAMLKTYFD